MAKNILIVESPTKAATIGRYLGGDYAAIASYGHIRDLPASKLGVDVEKDFEPQYIVLPKAKKTLSKMKKAIASAKRIYLACDLDREGEAIAWHTAVACGLIGKTSRSAKSASVQRIVFSEISRGAIKKALSEPRDINMNLVDAQQARRVLDRLVGYSLSPLLWKKVYKGLSAGRVQSAALRLVVEREREIEGFKPQEYWSIEALLEKDKVTFIARLIEQAGKRLDKLAVKSRLQAEKIAKALERGKYIVDEVADKEERRSPASPHTTSTLQQEASTALGYSARQTMRLAQNLYESGLITYMRTDSVQIAPSEKKNIQKFIKENFGAEYVAKKERAYRSKTKRAQEAHEAIRPVKVAKIPQELTGRDPKENKLYELIWKRAVASQMEEAIVAITEARIKNGALVFLSRGQRVKFDGFLKLYPKRITEETLPPLKQGDEAKLVELKPLQHFTEPPPRYSEASLIKELEEKGIGRPSTYAPIVSTIQERGYVIKEKNRLKPEKVGMVVCDLLVKHFPNTVDYSFTAKIEDELDTIAEGSAKWQEVVGNFYEPFAKTLEKETGKIKKVSMDEDLDEKCPECGGPLVIKHSVRGKFIGCSAFPDCHYTRNYVDPAAQEKIKLAEEQIKGRECPRCSGDLKIASGKFGPFIGCANYPKCRYIEKIKNESA